jgi:hypothetical protein
MNILNVCNGMLNKLLFLYMLFSFSWSISVDTKYPICPHYLTSLLGGSKHLGKLLQHMAGATAHTVIEDSHSDEL